MIVLWTFITTPDNRSRWYDQSLGRFIQPDTLVPNPGDPVAFDRYHYSRNSPLVFTDPSGHLVCSDSNVADGDCSDEGAGLWRFGIWLEGNWSAENREVVRQAAMDVGYKSSEDPDIGGTPWNAFQEVFGTDATPIYFLWGNESDAFWDDGSGFNDNGSPRFCEITNGGCTIGKTRLVSDGSTVYLIKFASMWKNKTWAKYTVVHEFGHLFNRVNGGMPYTAMDNAISLNTNFGRPDTLDAYGFASKGTPWQQAVVDVDKYWEIWADQYLGWTYGEWASNDRGSLRSAWMIVNMADWLK